MTTTAAAQTKPKAPADAPKAYTVEFVFEGTTYSGTMTLTVAKGTVSRPMMIDQPVPVTGDVAGTLKGDGLALDYAYTVKSDTVHRTRDGRCEDDSRWRDRYCASNGCSDAPLDGTFALKAAAK